MIDEDDSEKVDRAKRSSKARDDLTHAASSQEEEVRNHIVSQNTVNTGLITWMKSGVSFHVNPSPINLKEALSYLLERETYESTGSEVLDFYSYDIDIQFEIIMKILFPSRNSVLHEEPKVR